MPDALRRPDSLDYIILTVTDALSHRQARRYAPLMRTDAADPYATIAPFYDLATAGYDADLLLYRELARRGGPVLELGVGTGRVALALAREGHRVLGIDRSVAMLRLALQRARAEGLAIALLHGEMAAPPLKSRFGLLICALNGFLHLARPGKQAAALRAWRGLLAARGVLVLDLPGPGGDWGEWNPGARPLALDWTRPLDGALVTRFSTFVADPATQTRYHTDIFDVVAEDGTLRRYQASYPLRYVFPEEMLLLLERAGLRLRGRYGSYALDPFTAESERMIVVADRGGRSSA